MSKVKVFGFEECPYCTELMGYYKDNGVNYDYIDINKDSNREFFVEVSKLAKTDSVPIVIVNNGVLSPESSFKSIKEAYLMTNDLLSR